MANTSIKDARDTWGIRFAHTIDHDGLASYVQGGDLIPASAFGFKHISSVIASGSDNGAHFCTVRFTTKGGANTSFRLIWSVVATGVEVAGAVALNARFVRLTAIGR